MNAGLPSASTRPWPSRLINPFAARISRECHMPLASCQAKGKAIARRASASSTQAANSGSAHSRGILGKPARRGGRARLKAHAWRACKLGRVSGVQIPPSPPTSLYSLPTIRRRHKFRAERRAFHLEARRRERAQAGFVRSGGSPREENSVRFRIGTFSGWRSPINQLRDT
jgi:hypothetical protein